MRKFNPATQVDFVIIGSGAAGGAMAKELSASGFEVVVLEQGPRLEDRDFKHDELKIRNTPALVNDHALQPNTFRKTTPPLPLVLSRQLCKQPGTSSSFLRQAGPDACPVLASWWFPERHTSFLTAYAAPRSSCCVFFIPPANGPASFEILRRPFDGLGTRKKSHGGLDGFIAFLLFEPLRCCLFFQRLPQLFHIANTTKAAPGKGFHRDADCQSFSLRHRWTRSPACYRKR